MDNMNQPTDMQQAPAGEQATATTVTVTKNPDGTFTVGEHTCQDIEECLAYVRQALTGEAPGDDRMSVEEAFRGGFDSHSTGMGG